MRNVLVLLFFMNLMFSCEKSAEKEDLVSLKKEEIVTPKEPRYEKEYSSFLLDMKEEEKGLDKNRFFTFINQDVPHYWIGTKWDFNGTTRTPQEGKIACGYFVTNILSDYGFKIRRTYLAQQVSSKMIKELCDKKSIARFSDFNQLLDYLSKGEKQEVFIIGLDFHTGFIVKEDKKIYFIHSNFIKREGVVKELIDKSNALRSSKSFMIGSLTKNNILFQ